jgi:hypothetical protein
MNVSKVIEEFLHLRDDAHKSLAEELEHGRFRNGTEIERCGTYITLKVTICDNSQGTNLVSYGTLSEEAKYFMKVFIHNLPQPFRMEIDNAWSTPHINSYCPSDNHSVIPNWGTQNLSAIGSTITGQSIDNPLMSELIKRHIEWGMKN